MSWRSRSSRSSSWMMHFLRLTDIRTSGLKRALMVMMVLSGHLPHWAFAVQPPLSPHAYGRGGCGGAPNLLLRAAIVVVAGSYR